MLLSAVSVLVVAQSSSEIPEGLMNNPVFNNDLNRAVTDRIFLDADSGLYASHRDVQYKLNFNCNRTVIFIIVALLFPLTTEFYCFWTRYNRCKLDAVSPKSEILLPSWLHASTDSVPWCRPSCYGL